MSEDNKSRKEELFQIAVSISATGGDLKAWYLSLDEADQALLLEWTLELGAAVQVFTDALVAAVNQASAAILAWWTAIMPSVKSETIDGYPR